MLSEKSLTSLRGFLEEKSLSKADSLLLESRDPDAAWAVLLRSGLYTLEELHTVVSIGVEREEDRQDLTECWLSYLNKLDTTRILKILDSLGKTVSIDKILHYRLILGIDKEEFEDINNGDG